METGPSFEVDSSQDEEIINFLADIIEKLGEEFSAEDFNEVMLTHSVGGREDSVDIADMNDKNAETLGMLEGLISRDLIEEIELDGGVSYKITESGHNQINAFEFTEEEE